MWDNMSAAESLHGRAEICTKPLHQTTGENYHCTPLSKPCTCSWAVMNVLLTGGTSEVSLICSWSDVPYLQIAAMDKCLYCMQGYNELSGIASCSSLSAILPQKASIRTSPTHSKAKLETSVLCHRLQKSRGMKVHPRVMWNQQIWSRKNKQVIFSLRMKNNS